MEVSTDDVHDVKALPRLVDGAEANVKVSKVIGDGAYDSGRVYGFLEGRGIGAVIKPRRNSRLDTRCPGRRLAVGRVRELGYEAWARLTGYGGRWAVETAYSTFKRLFGELSLARSFDSIVRELVGRWLCIMCWLMGEGWAGGVGLSRVKRQPLQVNPQSKNYLPFLLIKRYY
jgi:hypothetical protein